VTGHITIGGRRIGPGEPAYVIAEMSANHNQSLDRAVEIVKAAKEAGANAIKLQTYTPDTLTIDCDNEYFRIKGTLWEDKTLYELYGEAYTPWEWQPELMEVANGLGLDLISTPFDETAVDFLEDIGVPAHKVASFENGDIPLLQKVGSTGKPVILSTGMASLDDLEEAVATLRSSGCRELALLKCTSAYPASPADANLQTIRHLSETFGVPIGLSDHTQGIAVPVAAVALGASIVEKHFTLSRNDPGPDSAFSLEPHEFRQMMDAVRDADVARGKVAYGSIDAEDESRVFRRSLFVVQDVVAGEAFTLQNVRAIRPGYGLHTRHLPHILGSKASRDVHRGTPLTWELVDRTGPSPQPGR